MKKRVAALMLMSLLASTNTFAQNSGTPVTQSADYWMKYTERLPVGSEIRIRTRNGQRTTGLLTIVDDTGITIEPKTRIPEGPRHLAFDELSQVELKGHSNVLKAVGIGAAVGAATFFGLVLFTLAVWGD